MKNRAPKLFLGVGNLLRRDDGVGVWAAQALSRLPLPPDVEVYEAGTAGAGAAGAIEGRRLVVVADAIEAGAAPGAIHRMRPEELRPYARTGLSLHDFHLLDALEEARLIGTAPQEVTVLAVQVGDVSSGIGLSPELSRSLPRLIRLAGEALGLPPWTDASTRNLETGRIERWD